MMITAITEDWKEHKEMFVVILKLSNIYLYKVDSHRFSELASYNFFL